MLGVTNLKSSGIEMRPVKYCTIPINTREQKERRMKQTKRSEYAVLYTVYC